MNPRTVIGDVWEGSLDIEENLLWDGGVRGLTIRMNSIDGAMHLDANFLTQWEQSERFARAVYVVFSPFASGKVNYEFMADNMPPKAPKRMFWDVEVKRVGFAPADYGRELRACYDLTRAHWEPTTYTGGWFLDMVTGWPVAENWWARYPWFLYPPKSVNLSWAEMRAKLDILRWVPACALPGLCRKWQCSGDRFKLPGTKDRALDINVFNGEESEYRTWLGAPAALTLEQKVDVLWKAALKNGWSL